MYVTQEAFKILSSICVVVNDTDTLEATLTSAT